MLTYHTWIYAENFSTRLDRWLKRKYGTCTQGKIEKAIRKRFIRLNGAKTTAGVSLQTGDIISLEIHMHETWTQEARAAEKSAPKYKPFDLTPFIFEETEDFLILNKPANLNVQGGTNVDQNLADALRQRSKELRLVHRLDRATSGVMIVAKNLSTAIFLTQLFREHKIKKNYRAIVAGRLVRPQGTINAPLLIDGLERAAQTNYTVFFEERTGLWSDVQLQPLTGRKHQLRRHMAALGHPIINDRKYDNSHQTYGLLPHSKNLLLHAQSLHFFDKNGRECIWTVPLPSYWPSEDAQS